MLSDEDVFDCVMSCHQFYFVEGCTA